MPTPNKGEQKKDYLSRCMAHPETNSKFPDQSQRYAVCSSMWERHEKSFEKTFEITKVDTEERKVFGIFSLVSKNGEPLVDLDGDIIDIKDLEKAAYEFNLNSRQAGVNHVQKTGIGKLVESFVFTKQKSDAIKDALEKAGVNDVSMNLNAEFWWGAFYIEDNPTWELIKSGEFASFSIGGFADRVDQ